MYLAYRAGYVHVARTVKSRNLARGAPESIGQRPRPASTIYDMQAFWNSKIAQWCIAILTVLTGGLMTLQSKDPATWEANKHWLLIALAGIVKLETITSKKPKTVEEALEDVLAAKKDPPSVPPAAVLLLLFVAALGPLACALTPTPAPGTPTTPTQTFEFCTTDALKAAGSNLLGDIANAVATDGYVQALEDLSVKFGVAEVKCAVELFVNSTLRKAGADKLAATEVSRANSWLSTKSP